MYLRERDEYVPTLDLRMDEPVLLNTWFMNIPYVAMSAKWKLNVEVGDIWHQHFADRVLSMNYGQSSQGANGQTIPGNVPSTSLSATHHKFDEWIQSSQDYETFATVKLKEFGTGSNMLSPLMLAPDIYCVNCDDIEPAWVYYGTENNHYEIYPAYKTVINGLLSKPLFDFHPELQCCPNCDPGGSPVTPNYRQWARKKPGACECMPCRRGL